LNQTRSPLLRLPAELRTKTYEYVYKYSFAGQEVSVQKQPGPDLFLHYRPLNTTGGSWSNHKLPMSRLEATSRQIRQETKNLFYTLNIFRGGPGDIVAFIRLLGPQAHRIQTVRIVAVEGFVRHKKFMEEFTLDVRLNYALINLRDLKGLKRVYIRCAKFNLGRHTAQEVWALMRHVLDFGGAVQRAEPALELEVCY
jgi:hypothetical protein